MKKIIVLGAAILFSLQMYGQSKLQATYNVANYQAYDSTTFFLGIQEDIKWIMVDFPTLNANDAVMFIGGGAQDWTSAGNIGWDGSAVSPDSVILNVATYTDKIRRSDGTRYATTRVYFRAENQFAVGGIIAFTFVWNSVTTGTIKIYF